MNEMTKMTGSCSLEQFWQITAEIGWGADTDCGAVKSRLLDLWDDEFIASFRGHLDELVGALRQRVEDHEQRERVSCECGDDGFGDLINHCVGMGREEYERCMEDPGLVVARGRASAYVENYSYCFPYEARDPGRPVAEVVEEIRAEREARGLAHDEDGVDEDELLMEAYMRVRGDKAQKEPCYYGAWARRVGRELEQLMDSEFGPDFGPELPRAVAAFTDVAKNEPEQMLPHAAEIKAILDRIEKRRAEMVRDFERRLTVLRDFPYWSCRNLVSDIEENILGESE